MEPLAILGGVVLVLSIWVLIGAVLFNALRRGGDSSASLSLIQQQMDALRSQMGQGLESTSRVVGDVRESLGQLSEAAKQIYEVGKDVSSLQDILQAPRLRGGLGEFLLADLLWQILPPANYGMQHRFKSGEVVDAVVHVGEGMVCVDSKFPLENFRKMIQCEDEPERRRHRREFVRDVRKHIDDIRSKYILPDEGTFDFALMYIPAENVYYETIISEESLVEKESLCSYAMQRRVIPVSPNSFYAYLEVIVLGLKGLRLEESAHQIMAYLTRLHGDFSAFQQEYEVLGGHLFRAKSKYDQAEGKLRIFGDRLLSTGGLSPPELMEGETEPDAAL
jgi:DNA recombination protein RmuC